MVNWTTKKISIFGSLLLFTAWLVNTIYFLYDYGGYIDVLLLLFSADGHMERPNEAIASIQILFIAAFFGWIGLTSQYSISVLSRVSTIHKASLCIIILMLITYPLAETKYGFLNEEDGFFEAITALFALLSSAMILLSIDKNKGRLDVLAKSFLFLIFFLFGMEEISWGQRLFGWETNQMVFEGNVQNETNIHNFFNEILDLLYPLFNLLICFMLVASIKLKDKLALFLKSDKHLYLLPAQDFQIYIPVFFTLFVHSIIDFSGGELTEQVFSVFILVYASHQLILKIQRQ